MITKDGYDRIEYLREIVNDGEAAKSIMKYIEKYKEEASDTVLKTITTETDKEKIAEAISDYRAVVRFCDMLSQAIALGERKEVALTKELKKK